MALFPASFELSSLDGTNGFVLNGTDNLDRAGYSVSSAGDINNDGIDDVLTIAPSAGADGEAYVVFGKSTGFSSSLDLSALNGNDGFILEGAPRFNFSAEAVRNVGDVNGDNISDIVIGVNGIYGGGGIHCVTMQEPKIE